MANDYTRIHNLPTADWGKSRTAFWEREATTPRTRQIKLEGLKANIDFLLPANVRVHGEIVVINNGGVAQAAITVGTAAAGTQVSAGAVAAPGSTNFLAATDSGAARTDRRIYIASAAWQANVHVILNVTEYPPVPDTSAMS